MLIAKLEGTSQWLEVYDLCNTFFCMLCESENTFACNSRISVCFLTRTNVQKHATKSDTWDLCVEGTGV